MSERVEIRDSSGAAMAVLADGKVYVVAESTPKDLVAAVMLASIGWSGARKLARHCMKHLIFEIYRFLDLERADDFVQAYVDARTRNPDLEPQRARLLVMPYWLLANGPYEQPTADQIDDVRAWLKPGFLKQRGRLSRTDLVALAYMGLEHEADAKSPMALLS